VLLDQNFVEQIRKHGWFGTHVGARARSGKVETGFPKRWALAPELEFAAGLSIL
jgi:hypothetical protein